MMTPYAILAGLVASIGSCARLEDVAEASSGIWPIPGPLPVRLWTWNGASIKHDLNEWAQILAATEAEILVTCQTEAVESIMPFLEKSGWIAAAGGHHAGSTGIQTLKREGKHTMNEQILGVFLRSEKWSIPQKKAVASKLAELAKASDWAKSVRFVSGMGGMDSKQVWPKGSDQASEPSFMRTDSTLVNLDRKGKGGVFATLRTEDLTMQILCAHLDSESPDQRAENVKQVLKELDEEIDTDGEDPEPPPDVRLILGDLNYRLHDQRQSAEEILVMLPDATRRARLQLYDPLSANGSPQASFITPDGNGFTCNEPHSLYLPTYNREIGNAGCERTEADAVTSCYSKALKKAKRRQGELETGWLDRLCWKADNTATIKLVDDKGFETGSYASASDHMAVSWKLEIAKKPS